MNTGEHLRTDILPGSEGGSLKNWAAVRKEIEAQVEDEFIDWKGDKDPRAKQQFMNATEEIFRFLGIGQGDMRRATDTRLNAMVQGDRFVRDFDEDKLQLRDNKFDFTPGTDFAVPYTAANVALGTVLSEAGILNSKDAAYALRSYLQVFEQGAGLDMERVIMATEKVEPLVQNAISEWRRSGSFQLPDLPIKDKDGNVVDTLKGDLVSPSGHERSNSALSLIQPLGGRYEPEDVRDRMLAHYLEQYTLEQQHR
jgi:hypothetical protein